MTPPIPPSWQPLLAPETRKPYWANLQNFLRAERKQFEIFPPDQDEFNALALTGYPDVKVLILGQDPYHDAGQAHGLAFSVSPDVPPPPSLKNIFREMKTDLGNPIPNNGCLESWARQGVLLLNAVLTVRAHQPASHQGKGWEIFTDAVISGLNARGTPVVFALWGNFARKKLALIDQARHPCVTAAHPSPLSAHRGFFGSRPFSQINACLRETGQVAIDWQIPNR